MVKNFRFIVIALIGSFLGSNCSMWVVTPPIEIPLATEAGLKLEPIETQRTSVNTAFYFEFRIAQPRSSKLVRATLTWGDGTTTPIQIHPDPSHGIIRVPHQYSKVGTFSGQILLKDDAGRSTSTPFYVDVTSSPQLVR